MSYCKTFKPADFTRQPAQAGTALVTGSTSARRFSTDTSAADPIVEQRRQQRLAAFDARLREQQKNYNTKGK